MNDEWLVGMPRIARRLGVCKATVAKYHLEEGLPLTKLGRKWRIDETMLRLWLLSKADKDRQEKKERRTKASRRASELVQGEPSE